MVDERPAGRDSSKDDWIVKVAMRLLSDVELRLGLDRERLERLAMSKLPSSWQNRHGDDVRIITMPDDYLVSALRFSIRGAVARREFRLRRYMRDASLVEGELGPRALDAFDMELDALFESGWRDHASARLASLALEAKSRGLPEGEEKRLSAYGDPLDAVAAARVLSHAAAGELEEA